MFGSQEINNSYPIPTRTQITTSGINKTKQEVGELQYLCII